MVVLIAAAYMLTQAGRRVKAQRGSCAHSGKVKELRMLGAPQRAKDGRLCVCRGRPNAAVCLLAYSLNSSLFNLLITIASLINMRLPFLCSVLDFALSKRSEIDPCVSFTCVDF